MLKFEIFAVGTALSLCRSTQNWKRNRVGALKLNEVYDPDVEFCPDGWDKRIEDYFRGQMIFEEDEDLLLGHLFECKHCVKHIAFLEAIREALGKGGRNWQ